VNPEPRKSGTYELPRGSVVGKYEIMRRLAVGGMAEIYLARVTGAAGFEKLCVLKRILPSVAEDPSFVQMFLDEAKLAATLRHPSIADVYDVGEDDGTYFFTMEYVYGQDVRAIRHECKKRNEQLPLSIALAIVHGTASALEHAHEKTGPDGKPLNLVHRDVSASNVMVSYDGAVKLLDFGIARASSSTHKTQTGTLKGKIPYMSPEQCKGLPLDRRSDLFSLGTVLYELTVGRRPFRGETDFAVMDQIVYKGAVAPSQLVQGYPPELEAIVMKLLERGPSMRYPTGEDLLHDLDEFVAKHGLWMSPRAIGKYMRVLFADKINAWEQAEQEGVPFAQYVAQTITSQSMRSETFTPPSELQSLPPRTTSEEMAIVNAPIGRISKPMRTFEPLPQVTPQPLAPMGQVAPSAQMRAVTPPMLESEPFSRIEMYPALRPKSSRTIMLAFMGALVLGAGGVIGYMFSRTDQAAASVPPAAAQPAEVKKLEAEPATSPPPAKPEVAQPAPPKPEPTVPVEVKRAPVEKPKPVVEKAKPVVEVKKPPPPAKPPVVKVKKKTEPQKEQTWDPNSPFLPH
jgi:serine/threonine protein kinase